MEYLGYTKILLLPYNSDDINEREEIKDFNIVLNDDLKDAFGIEKVSLLKKNELLKLEPKKLMMVLDRTLYISQNSLSETLKSFSTCKKIRFFNFFCVRAPG